MRIQTSRFGEIDASDDTLIEFPSGLIGLGGSRYAIVTTDESSSFRWLQSLEDPELALPVTDPFQFFADYAVELSDADSERIGTQDPSDVAVWAIVRAAPGAQDVTVNLRAPIVVHEGRGWQIINEAPGLDVRTPLFG